MYRKTMVYEPRPVYQPRAPDHPLNPPLTKAAVRGTAPQSNRPGLAPALRRARRHHQVQYIEETVNPPPRSSRKPVTTRSWVRAIVRKIDLNEYKRKQAPCLRVTTKAFGIGRRVPIAQRYLEKVDRMTNAKNRMPTSRNALFAWVALIAHVFLWMWTKDRNVGLGRQISSRVPVWR